MVGYHTLSRQVMREPLHLLRDLLLLSHTLAMGIPYHMAMLAMDSSLAMPTLAMLTWAMLLLLLPLRMSEAMLCCTNISASYTVSLKYTVWQIMKVEENAVEFFLRCVE